MAQDRPWYKRFTSNFISGTMHMDLEQKGAYSTVIDLIYDRSGNVPDDPQYIARVCGCSVRKWKGIREFLITDGKIYIKDGIIRNPVADKSLLSSVFEAENNAENGAKGAEKTNEKRAQNNKNKDIARKTADEKDRHLRSQRIEEIDTIVSISPEASEKGGSAAVQTSEVGQAFSMYNETAERIGLPKAQMLNKAREGKLAARLRDAGGLAGWALALEKVSASDFCSGRRSDFRASLDFLLQETSFIKLMEGNYDNGNGQNRPRPAGAGGNKGDARPSTYDAGVEGFSRAADRHARARAGNGDVGGTDAPEPARDLFGKGKGSTGQG